MCCHKICVSALADSALLDFIIHRQNQNLLGTLSVFLMKMSLGGKVLRD